MMMDTALTLIVKELLSLVKTKVGVAEEVGESKDLSVINEEAQRQALELQMAHAQAKVAQELAIAQRIQDAREVVIEEYYEGEAKGKVGVTGNEQGLTLGVAAEGRKVTKRVYRFIGTPKLGEDIDVIESET